MTEKISQITYYLGEKTYKVKRFKRIVLCADCDLSKKECLELKRPCFQHDPFYCVLRLVR